MREQRRIISRLQATNPSSDNGLGDDNLDETVADASQLQLSNDFYHRLVSVNVGFFLFLFLLHMYFQPLSLLIYLLCLFYQPHTNHSHKLETI